MIDPVAQFLGAIRGAGLLLPPRIIPDGRLHRFATNGDARDDSGWYLLHADGVPAGAFGDWRSGLSETWWADIGRRLSPQEEAAHRARVEAMRRERDAEDAKIKAGGREKAAAIWNAAGPAPINHPYLVKKAVKPHGLRVRADDGSLLVPMRDDSGALHSLHFIFPDGRKLHLPGGRVAGCLFQIGELSGETICIGEGFATMATVREITGHACVAAINRTSLLAVAQSFRKRFPDARIVLCADDDWKQTPTPGSPMRRRRRRPLEESSPFLNLAKAGARKTPTSTIYFASKERPLC